MCQSYQIQSSTSGQKNMFRPILRIHLTSVDSESRSWIIPGKLLSSYLIIHQRFIKFGSGSITELSRTPDVSVVSEATFSPPLLLGV